MLHPGVQVVWVPITSRTNLTQCCKQLATS